MMQDCCLWELLILIRELMTPLDVQKEYVHFQAKTNTNKEINLLWRLGMSKIE